MNLIRPPLAATHDKQAALRFRRMGGSRMVKRFKRRTMP